MLLYCAKGEILLRVDKFTLATLNKCQILKTIRENESINKAEIARLTGLSIPTAMKITDELVRQGIVRSCGKQEGGNGKRPEMYEFAGDDFFSIGIDIARTSLKAVVMSLSGRIAAECEARTGETDEPDKVLESVAELVKTVLRESRVNVGKILGIGVGMPGILDMEQGKVIFSPNFHWENVEIVLPLRNKIKAKTGFVFNIHMENSNRAQALGERFFGFGANLDYFICINLGYGIGSAVIENGEFYIGSSGTSGEIGHITVEKDGPICTCGNNGCLEALASGRAIAQQAHNLIANGISTDIINIAGGKIENVEAKTVFEAARQGDPAAQDLLRKAGEYIGIGIASYINLLDPEMIIIGGGMANEAELVGQIERIVKIRRMRFAGRKVQIRVSKLGAYATAVGAASILLKELLNSGVLPPQEEQEVPV